jgi:membrane-bound serine protease (ClpP class)
VRLRITFTLIVLALFAFALPWPAHATALEANVSPDLALVTLVAGLLAVYAEFLLPGALIPGIAGSVLILFGLAAIRVFPIDWHGAAWILAGLLIIASEVKFAARSRHVVCAGLTGVAACCILTGSMRLIAGNGDNARIHGTVALATTVPFTLVSSFLLSAAVRARCNKTDRIGKATLSC